MKKILVLLLLLPVVVSYAQEGQKINAGFKYLFGWHYTLSQIGNPGVIAADIGYEFDFVPFFGVNAGFGGGGFTQRVGLGGLRGDNLVYKGSFFSLHISPKFYLPFKYEEKIDRSHYIFIENKFAYNRLNWNFDRLANKGQSIHHEFEYVIKAGYQYPVGRSFSIAAWLGYSTLDYYKSGIVEFDKKLKTSTPIEIGIGFSYIFKYGKKNI